MGSGSSDLSLRVTFQRANLLPLSHAMEPLMEMARGSVHRPELLGNSTRASGGDPWPGQFMGSLGQGVGWTGGQLKSGRGDLAIWTLSPRPDPHPSSGRGWNWAVRHPVQWWRHLFLHRLTLSSPCPIGKCCQKVTSFFKANSQAREVTSGYKNKQYVLFFSTSDVVSFSPAVVEWWGIWHCKYSTPSFTRLEWVFLKEVQGVVKRVVTSSLL